MYYIYVCIYIGSSVNAQNASLLIFVTYLRDVGIGNWFWPSFKWIILFYCQTTCHNAEFFFYLVLASNVLLWLAKILRPIIFCWITKVMFIYLWSGWINLFSWYKKYHIIKDWINSLFRFCWFGLVEDMFKYVKNSRIY